MSTKISDRVHVIAGGYPPGALGGHDIDYARLRLLGILEERRLLATVGRASSAWFRKSIATPVDAV